MPPSRRTSLARSSDVRPEKGATSESANRVVAPPSGASSRASRASFLSGPTLAAVVDSGASFERVGSGPARSGENRESAESSGWLKASSSGRGAWSESDGGSSVGSFVNGSPARSAGTSEVRSSVSCVANRPSIEGAFPAPDWAYQ